MTPHAIDPILPDDLQEPFRSALGAATQAWLDLLGGELISLILFGSVARGQASYVDHAAPP